MSILDYAIIKEILCDDEIFTVYKTVGYARMRQFEFCQFITSKNNDCKASIIANLISLQNILPDETQYNPLYRDKKWFETSYMGFNVSSKPILLNSILSIVKPSDDNGLFFVSFDDGEIMKHIGYIQLC